MPRYITELSVDIQNEEGRTMRHRKMPKKTSPELLRKANARRPRLAAEVGNSLKDIQTQSSGGHPKCKKA